MNKYITLQMMYMYIKKKETKDNIRTKTINQVNKKEKNEFIKIDDETLLLLFSI